MARRRDLQCPGGCTEGRFEALNAPLIVGRDGSYLRHDDRAATFVCAVCRSVAVDVLDAAQRMARDTTALPPTLTCPACSMLMLPPEDDPLATVVECPGCSTQFAVEEGMPRLHGGGFEAAEPDWN